MRAMIKTAKEMREKHSCFVCPLCQTPMNADDFDDNPPEYDVWECNLCGQVVWTRKENDR